VPGPFSLAGSVCSRKSPNISVNRLLPAPVARFPFNASLQGLRLRMMRNRLMQLRPTATPRPVREI